jgi:hypothetical protein
MATKFDKLNSEIRRFISEQHIYFCATAGKEGHVNVSPRDTKTLKVIDDKKIVWLNFTGSGNETSAHIQENGRMTLMFCGFEQEALMLKIYGNAKVYHPRDSKYQEMISLFSGYEDFVGNRQIFELDIELAITSCGEGVPYFDYKGERENLVKWSNKKGKKGIEEYWKENNSISLDGIDTKIV